LSGRWNFASGVRHATWLLAICNLHSRDGDPLMTDDDGRVAERLMLIPTEQAQMIDTWQVSGLRGTGSFSFTVEDLFVPEHHVVRASKCLRREHGPLYHFYSSGIFGPSFGSVALGLADTSLAALVEMAAAKTPRGSPNPISQSATVQSAVGRSKARLGAARAYLHQTLSEVWTSVRRDDELRLDQRVAVRLAATHATHEAKQVVDTAYELAGSTAIFVSRPFERRFRDMHAVTQQLQARAAHFETVGRHELGLEPDTQFI
jgi:alkylation response protein AidB-like acyl-CoA dehydrogenase